MSVEDVDVVVIGGGAMGSAAARQLASRGRQVTLLERFEHGHVNGASHGSSRNFNVSYAHPTYLALVAEALRLWRELEAETGSSLLDQVGVVNHGDAPWAAVAEALPRAGFDAEWVDAAEAESRWPGLRFDGRVLFTPQAGRLHADRAVEALQSAAAASGARIRHRTRVLSIEHQDDHVLIRAGASGDPMAQHDGETFSARQVVVASGAWTSALVGGLLPLPRLVVTQEQPAHFAPLLDRDDWPGFNHAPSVGDDRFDYWPSPIYGMRTPGEGIKVGWHGVGPVTDPDRRTFRGNPHLTAALQRYVRQWIPGADPESFTEISCTYTTTPDSDFVIDRVGRLTVAAGFSGHGFKFTPAVGRLVADLVEGRTTTPEAFALSRFAS